jgi:hypothetical protein
MTEDEHRVLNYLYWLRDRGQIHPSIPSALTKDMPLQSELPQAKASKSHLPTERVKVLFLTSDTLLSAEEEMVHRIALALKLSLEHFKVVKEGSAHHYYSNFVVAMGTTKPLDASSISIPHPRDMLADPQLKILAWDRLQRLKIALDQTS